MRGATNDVSKNRKEWADDKKKMQERLSGLGGKLTDSPHAYEIARWVHPELTLIFYPHRTSAGNYHCRVRAAQCTNRQTLRKAIFALAENTCTFQFPTEQQWHNEGVMASIDRERDAIEAKAAKRTRGVALPVAASHWPILYAILRPAITTGNQAVRHHAERLAEVLEGEQRTALRKLLDCEPQSEPPTRVVHAGVALPAVPEPTDAQALTFHRALSDSAIGSDEVEDIKRGLRAVFDTFDVALPRADQQENTP